ncbi:MAG: HAMP domain-containing protein [Arhodomonas sp.]|nr:HAMP domain-containing protein [Arhodomonas sp.]
MVLLASLYLLNAATENSAIFGQLYLWLLVFNGLALVALVTVIALNIRRLVRSLRAERPGSRLTGRIMVLFALLAVVPGLVVYAFSMQFLRSGIDSWFDVRVEDALDDALKLSQASLDLRMRDMLKRVQNAADELATAPEGGIAFTVDDLRSRMNAAELTLFGSNGRIVASSTRETEGILPNRPEEEILLQLRQGRPYVGLDPIEGSGLNIRAAVPAPNPEQPQNARFLQALFPMSPRLDELATNVQDAFAQYRELAYLRGPLKDSFILTLSLVLLMSLLFAVWSAFYLARRLVAPISRLAEGTRALAEGNYGTQLPDGGRDELGFLVRSFNDMSRRVAQARDEAQRGQILAEAQRAYLETVLGRLSSGVLALDQVWLPAHLQPGGGGHPLGAPGAGGGRSVASAHRQSSRLPALRGAGGGPYRRRRCGVAGGVQPGYRGGPANAYVQRRGAARRPHRRRPCHRARRRHHPDPGPARCRLGRGGPAPGPRDPQSADAHTAVRRASPAQAQ